MYCHMVASPSQAELERRRDAGRYSRANNSRANNGSHRHWNSMVSSAPRLRSCIVVLLFSPQIMTFMYKGSDERSSLSERGSHQYTPEELDTISHELADFPPGLSCPEIGPRHLQHRFLP